MEEEARKINADYNNLEDPEQDVELELRFEEQLGPQDTMMERKCIPNIRNSINNCKRCCLWKCQNRSWKGCGLWS